MGILDDIPVTTRPIFDTLLQFTITSDNLSLAIYLLNRVAISNDKHNDTPTCPVTTL